MGMTTTVEQDQLFAIAESVFVAMVDGEEGLLQPWYGEVPAAVVPLVAWIDMHGPWHGRAALATELETATDLARALLGWGPDEAVDDADLVDAFGEVVNVVGGNLKSLLPDHGTLSLPVVESTVPDVEGVPPLVELPLSWRGQPVVVTVWALPTQA